MNPTVIDMTRYKMPEHVRVGVKFYDLLATISKAELHAFLMLLYSHPDATNTVTYVATVMNRSDQNRFYSGTKGLIFRKLVIRLKENVYLLNPDYFVPPRAFYEKAVLTWKAHDLSNVSQSKSGSLYDRDK